MSKQMNPVEIAMSMIQKIEDEEKTAYKVVYNELNKLDADYPKVTANHHSADLGPESLEYAYANLLFSSHAAYLYPDPPVFTRKDALTSLKLLNSVPNGRIAMMTLLHQTFPQAVVCVEHLYFLQRQVRRIFALPDADRPALLQGAKLEEWVYPDERIDKLRTDVIDLWKAVEDQEHADEAGV